MKSFNFSGGRGVFDVKSLFLLLGAGVALGFFIMVFAIVMRKNFSTPMVVFMVLAGLFIMLIFAVMMMCLGFFMR